MARQNADHKTHKEARNYDTSKVIDIEEAQRLRRERRRAVAKSKKQKAEEIPSEEEYTGKGWAAGRRLVFCLVAVAILALVIVSVTRVLTLKADRAAVEKELSTKIELRERLKEELSMVNDPKYIEDQARERLRMIKQGEILYVFENSEEDNSQ
jgi:cell division protein FtsB